jgi:hypothetical protein
MKFAGRFALPLFLMGLSTPLFAQSQAIFPSWAKIKGNSQNTLPFAGAPMRYQQKYLASDLKKLIKGGPVRLVGLNFRSKTSGFSGKSVTLEITLAKAPALVTSVFDSNLINKLIVVPKTTINLPTSGALTWVLPIRFKSLYTWDGKSDIMMDVRIYKNGNNNRPFLYFFDSVTGGPTERLYATGASSTFSQFRQIGSGLVTRFDYLGGAVVSYGKGCVGNGNVIPVASVRGAPVLGNVIKIDLSLARPQAPAVFLLGGSNSKWGAFNLPIDLTVLGAKGCSLLTGPIFLIPVTTIGGAPGSGSATLKVQVPPVNSLRGLNLYGQWMVNDQVSGRTFPFSFSNGIQLRIG